ncbi:MAG: 2OG-Fe(II) oxygenase, partial [Acidimicrobiales bacterium]
ERLAALLGDVASPGSFSTRRTAPVGDLSIEVRGLGPLSLPVSDAQARELCRIGRPARYGHGERTLLDPRVRDTWEIPLSRVRLDKRRWGRTLRPVLEGLRRDLGLPEGCELAAEFHSMLVYAPGQFFVPHQDSEKDDTMVGSLVVTLPSSFTGGALVVEHGGERVTYRSSRTSLSFVAFFADCRHQVQPTRRGHRVVLTYNLLLRGDTGPAATAEPAAAAAARCLHDHFTTPPSPRWAGDAAGASPPGRLAYLLDHEYTERGLSWSRLKGSDATRAAVLLAAGERAGCEVVLALAEVHETWSCFEDEWDGRRGWYRARRRHADDEPDGEGWDDEPDDAAGYELEDLIDGSVTVERWVHPSDGRAEAVAVSLADHEVCATTPSATLRPHTSEYEGYMGNYGNTMDRWYRRGAVILWPRDRAFAVRAEASPGWALDQLSARARAGDGDGAREMAAAMAPFWAATAGLDQSRGLPVKVLRVARALDEPVLASMLVTPLGVEVLTRSHAPALVALVDAYGEDWAQGLLDAWAGRRMARAAGRDRATWVASLVPLCEALQRAGASGTSTARLFVEDSWR